MNIVLPEKFYYKGKGTIRNSVAVVKGNELIINGTVPFKDMMYDLTYAIEGKKRCYYCGRTFPRRKLTLDHKFPLDVGGPTIPNNMVPCCSHCNSEKANMNMYQYKEYLALESIKEKRKLRKEVCRKHEEMRHMHCYELPADWVSEISLATIIVEMFFDAKFKGNKYRRIKEFYETYGYLQKPIIVNARHYLFSGFTELMYAREIGLQTVPAIVLDNVKVIL